LFFDVIPDRAGLAKQASFIHEPRKVQPVSSRVEVARFLAAEWI
jgi:hypothetical protein